MPTVRRFCPIVNQTCHELLERYGDLLFASTVNPTPKADPDVVTPVRREKKVHFTDRYVQFVTSALMVVEMHSKSVQHELDDYVDASRNLWKSLNMEDGRSLDRVEVSWSTRERRW